MSDFVYPQFGKQEASAGSSARLPLQRLLEQPPFRPLFSIAASARILDRIGAAILALGILFVVAYAILRPDYNWDMVAYVGTALEDQHTDPEELHRETWSRIDSGANERQEYHLKLSNPYNVHQWENPADFQSQLSMYRVKILYVAALKALDPYIGVVNAAFALSIVPALVFGILVLWWLWREKALQGAVFVLPLLMTADYLPLATVVTPDMLVTLVAMAAIYALYRGHDWLAAALLVVSVAIRPDNFVMIIAGTITALLFGWRKAPMLIAFAAGLALGVTISKLGHHPGWWPHFYFSNIQLQNSMTDFNPPFSLFDMTRGYVRGLAVTFQHSDWLGLLVVMSAGWALLAKAGKLAHPRVNAIAFMMLIGTLGKFASFPLPDDRFYFVFIAGMGLVLVATWKPQFAWKAPATHS